MARVIGADPGAVSRVPPHSLEVERSVLGAMMLERESCFKAVELLEPEHFYKPGHDAIFETMREMFNENEAVDLITVTNRLREKGVLDKFGGPAYIAGLVNVVPSIENTEHYARIVRDKAILRSCIKAANRMADMAYGELMPVEEIIEQSSDDFLKLSRMSEERDFAHMDILAEETHNSIKQLTQKGPEFLNTPFYDFNETYHGFLPGEYVIIAARPSVGKTSLALNIATHLAKEFNKTIVIFSLEMGKEQLAIRLISGLANVPADDINAGKIREPELRAIKTTVDIIKNWDIFIDDSPSLTVLDIRAKVKRLLLELDDKLDMIIIDYLQLMEAERGSRGENRVQQVTQLSRSLKALAREVNRPIIVLSQLSRYIEQRDYKHKLSTPQLSDLRESGALEQDADKVIFLHRVSDAQKLDKNNQFQWNKRRYLGKTETMIPVFLYVSKNRNGPCGQMLLGFEFKLMRFGRYNGDIGAGMSEDDMDTTRIERD